MFDVIVVGAGPAGAAAAHELARSGARVLILEAKKLPRYKTCGGGIPYNFFKTLPDRVQKTLESTFESMRCFGPKNRVFDTPLLKFAGVMRERFDYEFAMAAVEEGAELLDASPATFFEETGDSIKVKTRQGEFEGRYLIGADGATGIVKRRFRIGSPDVAAPALEMELARPVASGPAGGSCLIHFTIVRDGYAWVFPKGDLDSVGIASFERDRKKVKEKLAEWARISGYPLNGGIVHGHPIPVWKKKIKLSTGRCLLAGDAADCVDPFSGEGIRYAILSGRLAAEYARKALQAGPEILRGYSGAVYQNIHKEFRYSKWLSKLFYHFPDFFYHAAVCTQFGGRYAGQVMWGELKYGELFYKTLRHLTRFRTYKRLWGLWTEGKRLAAGSA